MYAHLRANLWLLGLTLLICCVLYPILLLGVGQTFFREQAQGSLIAGPDGKPIGSRLIAQPFTGDEYFQPRPSAVGYNAAASGGSNLAASNPALRERVARQLGTIVKYRSGPKKGQLIGPDVESWAKASGLPVPEGEDPRAVFFARWRQAHPDAELENVPADMVMASASGLDPHITLANARYQRDRVADAWAKKLNADREAIGREIDKLLTETQEAPLGGLAGGPLVHVLELNQALEVRLRPLAR